MIIAASQARAEGLALKAEVDAMGRRYDRAGEPYEDPRAKRNRYVRAQQYGYRCCLRHLYAASSVLRAVDGIVVSRLILWALVRPGAGLPLPPPAPC